MLSIFLQAQTNRALVVAIGNYPEESGWDSIHAANDCKLVVPMLKSNGYKENNIQLLLDGKATKKRIVKEFQNLAAKTRPEDYIYIHLSGHGQQMFDDNGDEPDGLDEAFIPYDARFRYEPGRYEGENHLRDDELGKLIDSIRCHAGKTGNVTVVIDACHSGTGTRNPEEDEYIRGTSYVFTHPGYKSQPLNPEKFQLSINRGKGLSPLTVFGACQPDEINYEYKTANPKTFYGRLTWFFCNLIMENANPITIDSFYFRLKEKMSTSFEKKNRKQTPYFESTDSKNAFIIGRIYGHTK